MTGVEEWSLPVVDSSVFLPWLLSSLEVAVFLKEGFDIYRRSFSSIVIVFINMQHFLALDTQNADGQMSVQHFHPARVPHTRREYTQSDLEAVSTS